MWVGEPWDSSPKTLKGFFFVLFFVQVNRVDLNQCCSKLGLHNISKQNQYYLAIIIRSNTLYLHRDSEWHLL